MNGITGPQEFMDYLRARMEQHLNKPMEVYRLASPPIGFRDGVDTWASSIDREWFEEHPGEDHYFRTPLKGELGNTTSMPDRGCGLDGCAGHAMLVLRLDTGVRSRAIMCSAMPNEKPYSYEAAQAFGLMRRG